MQVSPAVLQIEPGSEIFIGDKGMVEAFDPESPVDDLSQRNKHKRKEKSVPRQVSS
jgi:hypothetical protein